MEVMAKELTDGGIAVVSQRKANDGLVHIALCNSATGRVNAYEISAADFHKATALGFSYFATPETAKSILGQGDSPATFRPTAEGLPMPWPFPW